MLLRLTLILTLLFGISVWGLFYLHGEKAVLEESNKILTEASKRAQEREAASRQLLVARQAKIAAQTRKLAEAQQGLSEALRANKSWSDTDVPTDVQKALQAPYVGL